MVAHNCHGKIILILTLVIQCIRMAYHVNDTECFFS